MANIIDPPPHPKTPVVNPETGLVDYTWHKWFTQLVQTLNNEGYVLRGPNEVE